MTDRILPCYVDAAKRQFYTKRGFLTRYALACGYVEIRGNDESGVRLEQISSNGTLRVVGTGRWIRGELDYFTMNLTEARKRFMSVDHVAKSKEIAAKHFA